MVANHLSGYGFKFFVGVVHCIGFGRELKQADVVVAIAKGDDLIKTVSFSHLPYTIGLGALAVMNIEPSKTFIANRHS